MVNVKIKLKTEFCRLPLKANSSAACYDVFAHSITSVGITKIEIGLGFMTEIPEGWKGVILPRSGISRKDWVLSNSIGQIDPDYRGEWKMIFKYVGEQDRRLVDYPYAIGDRVGQIYFCPIHEVNFSLVEELSDTERGSGGFGSTGK